MILEAFPDISLSEDPSIIFHYVNSGGPLMLKLKIVRVKILLKTFLHQMLIRKRN